MKEIMCREQMQVTGGGIPAAIVVGVAGSYVYESIGGKPAIDRYFSNSWAATKASFRYWYRKLT
ncbi:hypothetical protein [Alteromonas sp. H39]|uniref:hypothetical protein n=1 Tax=Alteromonas sp. H39 TaxID=3389876 RepID=UPI0039E0C02F